MAGSLSSVQLKAACGPCNVEQRHHGVVVRCMVGQPIRRARAAYKQLDHGIQCSRFVARRGVVRVAIWIHVTLAALASQHPFIQRAQPLANASASGCRLIGADVRLGHGACLLDSLRNVCVRVHTLGEYTPLSQ